MQTTDKADIFKLIEDHYREHRTHLVNLFARRVGGARHRAEDIVQEGYTRALSYWKSYDPTKPINDWLYQIMNNASRDERTAEAGHGMVSKSVQEERVVKPSAIPSIMYERIVKLIDEKPEPFRTVIYMSLISQHTPKEVAQVVNSNANNVRQQVYQFRQEIRDKYRWSI